MWSPLNALIAIDAGLFSRYKCCGSGSLAVTIQTTFLPNKWGDLVDVVEKSSGDTLKRKGEGKGRVEEGKGDPFCEGFSGLLPSHLPLSMDISMEMPLQCMCEMSGDFNPEEASERERAKWVQRGSVFPQ